MPNVASLPPFPRRLPKSDPVRWSPDHLITRTATNTQNPTSIPPGEEELRRQLEVPESMLRKLLSLRKAPATVSFNGRNADGEPDEEEGDAMAGLTDRRQPSPSVNVARADLREWLTRGFSRRDRLIVILYYYEEMTMRQIGQTIGWSESRVSQRLDSIIGRLRARFCHTASEHEFQFT